MADWTQLAQIAGGIRRLAGRAMASLPRTSVAYQVARRASVRPVDYMRCGEFQALLRLLRLQAGMKVLDVGSPQWLSLYLADKHPDIHFDYINILEAELAPFRDIAQALGLGNLTYRQADIRECPFADRSFDKVLSVSVIEHIAPEEGGDVQALVQIKRLLEAGGELIMTVPFKTRRNIVYVDGPVYERRESTRNFFAREYDAAMFEALVRQAGFASSERLYIGERSGVLAVDYYEWGPGQANWLLRNLVRARSLTEKLFRVTLEETLAQRYLAVGQTVQERVVNVCASLRPARVDEPHA